MTATTRFDSKRQSESPTTKDIKWPARWRDEVVLQTQSLRLLQANWDSYGAARISAGAIHWACAALPQLALVTDQRPSTGPTPQSESPTTKDIKWPARWRDEAILQTQSLLLLKVNWDSYGAARIGAGSIHWACKALLQLALVTDHRPSTGPTPLGHINVWWTWDQGTKTLELEFLPNGGVHACFTDERDSSKDYEDQDSSWTRVLSLIPGA